jgi:lipopolysaccharide/colanic/teichoic acid biosynthesis glycosyltransferase
LHTEVFIVYDGGVGIIYQLFVILVFILCLPVMVVIYTLVVVFSGFPVIFSQKRVGLAGRPFMMYKFRTMVVGAEKLKSKFQHLNIASGPAFKIRNDPRFTQIGKFLSHTGLDELPQIFNVIRGDMALIGPRPLPVTEAQKLQKWQKKREMIKPGIISPWIMNGYHTNTFDNWMKSDIEYTESKTFVGDLKLFSRALGFMARLFVVNLGILKM